VTTQTDHPKPARPSIAGTSGRPPRCGCPAERTGGGPRLSAPIRQVPVVRTARVQIRPGREASSWRRGIWRLPASRRWAGPRPSIAYLVHHGDGPLLFGAGHDPARASSRDLPGRVRMSASVTPVTAASARQRRQIASAAAIAARTIHMTVASGYCP
jgi:hypothetical protein